ncbi:MAG: endonuclease/exonuclease/phosphatase family protein [Gemmatimonadetes bacterium]|nr:endonuclease/exonuclease/phosphatase family protein [Gemmatimonadota bacterium]
MRVSWRASAQVRVPGSASVRRAAWSVLLGVLLVTGCRTGRNYATPDVPRYEGEPSRPAAVSTGVDTLLVVAFNIRYSQRIDRAIDLLVSEPDLTDADILLLTEMDENGTWLIADALGMYYAYYPAVHHVRTGRDFGNAVLSRWPIVGHERITLPHTARFQRTHRTATAATIRVGMTEVRAYATHLGTFFEIGPGARQEQLRTILEDAQPYARAIIGGDMNDGRIGPTAGAYGFTWPTQYGPNTMLFGRVDHIFLKNLPTPDSAAAGTVRDSRGASDHLPVWTRVILRIR